METVIQLDAEGLRRVAGLRGETEKRPLRGVRRAFGDLRVRPKLIVLHNLFFLVLAAALYLAVWIALGPEATVRVRWAVAAALAIVYLLAVLLLELVIMPTYVYRPLRLMLAADEASHQGDRGRELIDAALIPGDEIGQIMRSRNDTIAELRRQEDVLETARRSLADQDRLASIGLLSASVAHELNTPLAVLHGSIEKLLETVRDPAAQERLARMRRVTERLRNISASLLDFARVRTPRREPVAMREVVDEAWRLVSIDDRAAAVSFSNEVSGEHQVSGDADRLIQVFVNLLRNALNAVRTGGHIAVRSTLEAGNQVALAVEDDGHGIPADILPRMFEAFVSSRLDARGTGLGLAVAGGIIERHGGTISASNRPGGGARIELHLPGGPS